MEKLEHTGVTAMEPGKRGKRIMRAITLTLAILGGIAAYSLWHLFDAVEESAKIEATFSNQCRASGGVPIIDHANKEHVFTCVGT